MKEKAGLYSNDKKAPRMRKGQFSKQVVTKELYKKFKIEFPEYSNMKWDEFYKCWLEIAEKIRHESVTNPLGVKLGSHTGELKLQYLPYKLRAIDHNLSQTVGEEIAQSNIQNKGKVGKIKWERRWAVKFNKILQFYAFDETREMNRLAFKYIEDNYEKVRIARVTLGGQSVWRQKMKNK